MQIILTVVILSASMIFALAFITYAFFWYETANGPYLAELKEMSKNKAGRWILRGIISGTLSILAYILLYPFSFFDRLWKPEPDTTCPMAPVVLVHGLVPNPGCWALYRWMLKRNGFTNSFAFGYNALKYSFDELLAQLDRTITQVVEPLGQKRVVLIGHSLGGLIVRAYADLPENAEKVAAVITLGAPHQGTKLAVLGLGKLTRSLAYRGPLIRQIEERTCQSDIPRLAVYSPVDSMVLPAEAMRVPFNGWKHVRTSPVSHTSLLFNKPTVDTVISHLNEILKAGSSLHETTVSLH